MMQKQVLALVLTGSVLTACGHSKQEQDGVMIRVNHQMQVIRDPAQQKALCATTYCEPNYIIHQTMGQRRSSDDSANPAPTATPMVSVSPTASPAVSPTPVARATPTPTATPAVVSNNFNYSRKLMNVESAWSVTQGDPEVVVAVIDSGIDLDHPDLKDSLWTNKKESNGVPGTDNDGNGYKNDVHGYDFFYGKGDPTDETGHGTHCAGIIAAQRDSNGVVGVAPKVKVMALRFIGPDGTGATSDAIDAIYYAIKMGAKVISASWGGEGYSSYLAQAVEDAQKAGVIFVAAAGNDGNDTSRRPFYPGSHEGVISVAASGATDLLSDYSNYGKTSVTIAAPGDDIFSTYLDQGFESLSGSSMAGPQIAGAIALAISKNKSVLPSAVSTALCSTADSAVQDSTKCGRVNVGRLVNSL